jgi:acetyltransferase-like isoleucine patch superfamily enzyme
MSPDKWIRKIRGLFFGTKSPAKLMDERIEKLRRRGVRIGEGCQLFTNSFSTEPYLVDIGNRVGISGGTQFITHDASVWLIRPERPKAQVLGRIRVGDNTFIGENCLILPGTTIGAGCVIAAGSVVRGIIPDNSLVIGNPSRIVGRASLLKGCYAGLGKIVDTLHLPEPEREAVIRRHFGL